VIDEFTGPEVDFSTKLLVVILLDIWIVSLYEGFDDVLINFTVTTGFRTARNDKVDLEFTMGASPHSSLLKLMVSSMSKPLSESKSDMI